MNFQNGDNGDLYHILKESGFKTKEEAEAAAAVLNHGLNQGSYIKESDLAKTERKPGYPIVIKMVQLRMARLLKRANLNPELTPHSLRHTCTSLIAEASVALEQIMARLGHSDDKITKNVYLHVTKEMKKEASQKFA